MKVDFPLDGDPAGYVDRAVRAERIGFAGVWAGETDHDALLPAALAAHATARVDVGTRVVVAFARSPMSLAICGNDLQMLSRGRFVLGLGSQVRAHIEHRYGVPWSRPAARMRELIAALRAIWTSWAEGTPLDFRGEFSHHTLTSPAFRPPKHDFGFPRIGLAATGPMMLRVAADMADVVLVHSFMTERYLRETILPTVHATRRPEISLRVLLATGRTEEELAYAIRKVRAQVAFYASTPSYVGVLRAHGWEQLQVELAALARQGRWSEMPALVDDEVLRTVAVVGEPAEVPGIVRDRFTGCADRIVFRSPTELTDDEWSSIVRALDR